MCITGGTAKMWSDPLNVTQLFQRTVKPTPPAPDMRHTCVFIPFKPDSSIALLGQWKYDSKTHKFKQRKYCDIFWISDPTKHIF